VPGPDNLGAAIVHRASLRGFLVFDHFDLYDEYLAKAVGWLASGELTDEQTVVDGIDHAVEAFRSLLAGANTGKMVVRL
jgi:NADPH-dependent curcumin reductase CurA